MYPDLSYFFHDLLGTPVDNFFAIFKTFGLFLALSFVVSGYVLYREFLRMESKGYMSPIKKLVKIDESSFKLSVLSNALFGFFVGWKLPYVFNHFTDFKIDPASIVFSSKGNILLGILGALVIGAYGYFTGRKDFEAKKGTHEIIQYPHQKTSDIIIVAAISGVFGARLFSILENLDSFWQDPIGQLFSGSGLTIYGGLIVATAIVYWYIKRMGLPPLRMMDAAAPPLVVGMLIGRLGCQFSGDGDWGIVNTLAKPSWFVFPDWAWSYKYPHNVNMAGVKIPDCEGLHCTELLSAVFPTPIYEVAMMSLIFAILWSLRKKIMAPGVLFFIWMILTGIMRFLIEFIRVNERYEILGFNGSQAHYISIGYILVGICGCIFFWNRYNKSILQS